MEDGKESHDRVHCKVVEDPEKTELIALFASYFREEERTHNLSIYEFRKAHIYL
jgi:hypothetical protein